MTQDVVAVDDIISGTAIPALYIFVKYDAHEPELTMDAAKARIDFLSTKQEIEAKPNDTKGSIDTKKCKETYTLSKQATN